jgi:hypothetical protein
MNPLTPMLFGWTLAQAIPLTRRDRALVTLAGVVPDIDGLGVVAEILTRDRAQPLLWWSEYHHVLPQSGRCACGHHRRDLSGAPALGRRGAGVYQLSSASTRRPRGRAGPMAINGLSFTWPLSPRHGISPGQASGLNAWPNILLTVRCWRWRVSSHGSAAIAT